MKLDPETLVPGHGAPVVGKEKIKETLTNYRDAILHVHNLALEAVQKFKPLDEVVAQASLPPHLAQLPYLKEYYGYIPFCVRSIYQSYVGWFDGDPANLQPLSRKEFGADVLTGRVAGRGFAQRARVLIAVVGVKGQRADVAARDVILERGAGIRE